MEKLTPNCSDVASEIACSKMSPVTPEDLERISRGPRSWRELIDLYKDHVENVNKQLKRIHLVVKWGVTRWRRERFSKAQWVFPNWLKNYLKI